MDSLNLEPPPTVLSSSSFSVSIYNFVGFAAENDVKLSLYDNQTPDCVVNDEAKVFLQSNLNSKSSLFFILIE